MPASTSTIWSKTVGTALHALQSIASNTVVIAEMTVPAGSFAALLMLRIGRTVATALTLGAIFRIEVSMAAAGDGYWVAVQQFQSVITACEAEAVSGTVAAGQNVVTVASTTNIAAGARIFLLNGTVGNSEWGRVKSIVSNTSFTLEDNLLHAQTGATAYTLAEDWQAQVDLTAVKRIRVVCDFSGTGQAVAAEVIVNTGDSLTTA